MLCETLKGSPMAGSWPSSVAGEARVQSLEILVDDPLRAGGGGGAVNEVMLCEGSRPVTALADVLRRDAKIRLPFLLSSFAPCSTPNMPDDFPLRDPLLLIGSEKTGPR